MWLAAVIDCEGWIGLTACKRDGASAYYGGVGVGNTNRILIDKLVSLTGMGFCMARARKYPAKNIFQWQVAKRDDVDDILVTIRPHLLLKGAQADLLLSLPSLYVQDNAARAAIKSQLSVLNRKGVERRSH